MTNKAEAGGVYLSAYQLLDEAGMTKGIPVGARGAIFAAIDRLRRAGAPAEHVRLLEEISLALHRLELALRDGDEEAELAARQDLRDLHASWLHLPARLAACADG